MGKHICALYQGTEEQLATAAEYIRGGLSRREQCLFICGEQSVPQYRKLLAHSGIDVDREEARGALVLGDKKSYLPDGVFDPDQMLAMLDRTVKNALTAGFTGLRSAGDMAWLLEDAPGSDRLAEYEAQLNQFCRTHKAIILCLYDRNSLPAAAIDHSLATHRYVHMAGVTLENPFYESDHRSADRQPADPEIVTEKLDILDATRLVMGN